MTIFSKIINREIPAKIVFENDELLAFRDINPIAPVHILVIPKKPLPNLSAAEEGDCLLLGRLLQAATIVAEQEGIAETGYRTVINNGDDGGQTVDHLHLHLIGGKPLGWPPFTERMKHG